MICYSCGILLPSDSLLLVVGVSVDILCWKSSCQNVLLLSDCFLLVAGVILCCISCSHIVLLQSHCVLLLVAVNFVVALIFLVDEEVLLKLVCS